MFDATYYRNKTVLVTGHTGFKGSWLCHLLNMCKANVCGYSLNPPTDPSLYEISKVGSIVQEEIGDITDFEKLYSFFKKIQPDVVIHLAAQPLVRESYIHPSETYMTNVIGTVNIMECLRLTNCTDSFLNVTTDKVYDNIEVDKYYKESDSLDGFDPYSNSKSCSELVTHSYKRSFFNDSDCKISTARAGNVIGGGDFSKDRIIPDCVRAALSNRKIILRSPNSIRPYQHVLEPLTAYLTIIAEQSKNPNKSGSYNVGPRKEDCISTGELASLFCKYWSNSVNWISQECDGPHEANFLKLDSTLIKKTFGFEPVWHIEDAVCKTVEWTKAWVAGENISDIMESQISEYFGGML